MDQAFSDAQWWMELDYVIKVCTHDLPMKFSRCCWHQ